MTSKRSLHILSLPQEHFPQIVSYLTLNDVCQLRLVATLFRDTQRVHHLWMDQDGEESHNTSQGRGIMTSRRLQRMLSIFTNISSLRLFGLKLLDRSSVTHRRDGADRDSRHYLEVLQNASCAQNIECLELLGVWECDPFTSDWGNASTPTYSVHVDVQFPKLKRLAIEGKLYHRELPLLRSLLRSSRQITHLRVGGEAPNICNFDVEIAMIQYHNDTLEELILDGYSGKIVSLKIQSKVLRTLNLSGCQNLTVLQLECPNIEVLDLSNCSKLSSDFLQFESLSKLCPRLKVLKLRMNMVIADLISADKIDSKPYFPHLEHIDIRECPLLRHMSVECPFLRKVEVRGCNHMQSLKITSPVLNSLCVAWLYSLEELALDCPSLIMLDISGCHKLSEEEMHLNCPILQSSGIIRTTDRSIDILG